MSYSHYRFYEINWQYATEVGIKKPWKLTKKNKVRLKNRTPSITVMSYGKLETWNMNICSLFCRRTSTLKHLKRMAGINYTDLLKEKLVREITAVIRNKGGKWKPGAIYTAFTPFTQVGESLREFTLLYCVLTFSFLPIKLKQAYTFFSSFSGGTWQLSSTWPYTSIDIKIKTTIFSQVVHILKSFSLSTKINFLWKLNRPSLEKLLEKLN